MFCLWLTQRKVAKYLSEPIRKWGWDPLISEEDKALAKAALKETLCRAKQLFPKARRSSVDVLASPVYGKLYLQQLYMTKKALDRGSWNDACSELVDVIKLTPVVDRRSLYTLISLLETYL